MKQPSLTKELKSIFPRGSVKEYKRYLIRRKGSVNQALHSYGLFAFEQQKYKKEIIKLKAKSKKWYAWYKKMKGFPSYSGGF